MVTHRCEKMPVPNIRMVPTKNPKSIYEGLILRRVASSRRGVKFSKDSSILLKREAETFWALESISTILVIKLISNYYTSSGFLMIAKHNITVQVWVLFPKNLEKLTSVKAKIIIDKSYWYLSSGSFNYW
jgi:hypothetical protein